MGSVLSQLAAAGAMAGDDDGADGEPVIYLWPESVDAWAHWQQLQTQWRSGMGGVTGLCYAGVRAYLDEQGIEPGPERRELFDCIQACENACLHAWAEIREREQPPQHR